MESAGEGNKAMIEEICDCGAVSDGKWADVHSKNCASIALPKMKAGKFRMHDMEPNVIVRVDDNGVGGEFCNTLNSFGDQGQNAAFILAAIHSYQNQRQP
jgi:hypothetical protein